MTSKRICLLQPVATIPSWWRSCMEMSLKRNVGSPTNVHEALNGPNEASEATTPVHGGCLAASHRPEGDF